MLGCPLRDGCRRIAEVGAPLSTSAEGAVRALDLAERLANAAQRLVAVIQAGQLGTGVAGDPGILIVHCLATSSRLSGGFRIIVWPRLRAAYGPTDSRPRSRRSGCRTRPLPAACT